MVMCGLNKVYVFGCLGSGVNSSAGTPCGQTDPTLSPVLGVSDENSLVWFVVFQFSPQTVIFVALIQHRFHTLMTNTTSHVPAESLPPLTSGLSQAGIAQIKPGGL